VKPKLAVICTPRGNNTERHLFPALRNKFDIILLPVHKETSADELKRQTRDARLVLNTADDWPNTYDALEITKALEGMGKRVIDSSRSFYTGEDKWNFYQLCRKHKLPTPETYYLPRDILLAPARLKKLLEDGPLVIKAAVSDTGRAVKRAKDYAQAVRVIKQLRKRIGNQPLIAQRYVPHGNTSYRVTLAGDKIIQAVVKKGKNWKEGKLFWKNEKYRLFKPTPKLAALCRKAAKIFGLEWCGIDLMQDKNGKWQLIEVNSCPSMDFVLSDMKRANEEVAKYLLSVEKKLR
jgi:ribosomal protein S6--L-glutamate ligase